MQRASVNRVLLVGRVGNKPDGGFTPSGTSTAHLSLATNETWTDSDGNKKEHTQWTKLVAWGKLADFVTQYIQKGQLIFVEGKLRSHNWKDKEGVERKTTEVILDGITPLEWRDDKKGDKPSDAVSESGDHEELPF